MRMVWGVSAIGPIKFAFLDALILLYFGSRALSPTVQHRIFHWFLTICFAVSVAAYAATLYFQHFAPAGVAPAVFWWQFVVDVIFAFCLVGVVIYALARRRISKDPSNFLKNANKWLDEVMTDIRNFFSGG